MNLNTARPLLLERFPEWESRAEYWQVGDIDVAPPKIELSSMDSQIHQLLSRLPNFKASSEPLMRAVIMRRQQNEASSVKVLKKCSK